jgi:hypothetical protein
VILGDSISEYTREWQLTSEDLEGKTTEEQTRIFCEKRDVAMAYASNLSDPTKVNWVTLVFVWI